MRSLWLAEWCAGTRLSHSVIQRGGSRFSRGAIPSQESQFLCGVCCHRGKFHRGDLVWGGVWTQENVKANLSSNPLYHTPSSDKGTVSGKVMCVSTQEFIISKKRYGERLGGSLCDTSKMCVWQIIRLTSRESENAQKAQTSWHIITMVLELLAPPAAWIWWAHAAWGVGGLAHIHSKAAVEVI